MEQVLTELRTAWPGRVIQVDVSLDGPILADRSRLSQLLSNLTANALTHGDPSGPVGCRPKLLTGASN